MSLSKPSKIWLGIVFVLLAAFAVAAFALPHSFGLTATCDITESLLLISGAASFLPLAVRSRGRMRLFWSLIIFGLSLWLTYQLLWTYYEVVLQKPVPFLFAGDIVLFLDIVPLMAALALRAHAPEDEYSARLGRLDFALLMIWWLYLYVLIVIPWQYVVTNEEAYNNNLDTVYFIEKIAYLVALTVCWIASKGQWKKLYANLFGMSFSYVASSTLANWAITRNVYYSGSIYDVPLAGAMAWLTWIGLTTKAEEPQADAREVSTVYGVWVARTSMIAVFSLPLFGVWAIADEAVPAHIRLFRLALTMGAAFVMGLMVFTRQHLLDRELMNLLERSHDSVSNLHKLQAQVLQTERLASIGQLVGGAAHELNNPITAMLGYSDLLVATELGAEQRPVAVRIGHYVRRARSLVASLISFSRQSPAPKMSMDLNSLVRTAMKLAQPQCESMGIQVQTQFDHELPKVKGDSNQLLQVCLQLVANCLHVIDARGGKVLNIATTRGDGKCVLNIATDSTTFQLSPDAEEVFPADIADTLGLSACQGILQEHGGSVSNERCADGSLLLRVELPAAEVIPVKPKPATAPGLWQSPPFA